MSVSFEKAQKLLQKWVDSRDKTNLKFFEGTVIVHHQDDSHFVFRNANAKGVKAFGVDFVLVATEHCGYHVFVAEDLETWSYFPRRSKTLSWDE